jgi:hypothetical protein
LKDFSDNWAEKAKKLNVVTLTEEDFSKLINK